MSDLQQQNRSNVSDTFDGLIHEAMDEISNRGVGTDRSFQMPVEILYLVALLLIVSVVYHQPFSTDTHPGPTTAPLESGKRVALLTFAEEIDAYQRNHNKLPKKIPSPLASALQVEYKILGANHYKLIMSTSGGELVLDHQGSHEDIYLESEES